MYSAAKLVVSGSIAEFYLYKHPIEYGYQKPKVHQLKLYGKTEQEKQESRERSVLQTRRRLRNILQSNAWQFHNDNRRPYVPLFVTFTFRENITDLSEAHREFKYFIQRFNYRFYGKNAVIKYLAVPEFQKRGAVHYHVVFLNVPYIERIYDVINELWGKGFMLVETIKSLDHLVNYVAKYLTAEALDERLSGRKRYFTSLGLKKSRNTRNEKIIDELLKQLPKDKIKYQGMYVSPDGQQTEYVNYDFGQGEKLLEHEYFQSLVLNN
jgi:hypothetical protein